MTPHERLAFTIVELRERNAKLVAALEKIAGLDPEHRYYGRTPYDLAVVIAREALAQ